MKLSDYLKEMRPKHWIKNTIVLLPAFFANKFTDPTLGKSLLFGFLSFCFMSSAIYFINDIHDIEKDRLHPIKKLRPIASGSIPIHSAGCFSCVLILLSYLCLLILRLQNYYAYIVLSAYALINLLYSVGGLKNYALLDVVLLASGFWLRLVMGGCVTGVPISDWLHLVVITGSLFMGFGKRRGELQNHSTNTRVVLKQYGLDFLNKAMYSCLTLTIVFFALWCKERGESFAAKRISFIMLVPILMVILFRYCMDIEQEHNDGDPVNVILEDKLLIIMVLLFAGLLITLFYLL